VELGALINSFDLAALETAVESRRAGPAARRGWRARNQLRTMERLTDTSARRLSAALVRGDTAALGRLYDSRFDWMLAMLMHATRRDESFALDCAQDAWIRVARSPVECAGTAALDAWLRRVALSAALDRLRSDAARRLREMEAAARASAHTAFVADLEQSLQSIDSVREALASALERCGEDERGLLLMRFRAGMTLGQIAAACGVGAAAVDSRIRRTLESLRGALTEKEAVR